MQDNDESYYINPPVTHALQRFILALVKNTILYPVYSESSKIHLKAFCKAEKYDFNALEYNFKLFFELLEDYRKTLDIELYRFLKIKARYLFLDEDLFNQLPIFKPLENSECDSDSYESSCSADNEGIVGGHLIGF